MKGSLSFDEKFLTNVFKKYQKIKVILAAERNSLHEDPVAYGQGEKDIKQLIDYQQYCQTIETILTLLPKAEYTCLVKDFLSVDDKNWWKQHYSQEKYQKLKYKAITRFLYLFLI